jgi:hypothetical protein
MPSLGLEPTTPAGEQLQTYALDRAATGTGKILSIIWMNSRFQNIKQAIKQTKKLRRAIYIA